MKNRLVESIIAKTQSNLQEALFEVRPAPELEKKLKSAGFRMMKDKDFMGYDAEKGSWIRFCDNGDCTVGPEGKGIIMMYMCSTRFFHFFTTWNMDNTVAGAIPKIKKLDAAVGKFLKSADAHDSSLPSIETTYRDIFKGTNYSYAGYA